MISSRIQNRIRKTGAPSSRATPGKFSSAAVQPGNHGRTGFSLMEVLLATSILLGSILVLMDLTGIGRYYIRSVEDRTTAQMLCQSKLNEILAGLAPVEEVQNRAVPDYPDWKYSVEIQSVANHDISRLRVTVTEVRPTETAEDLRGQPKTFTLNRWIPNPTRNSRR